MKLIPLITMLFGLNAFGAQTGAEAPDFTLPGHDGKTYTLSDFKGKSFVVLEWFNNDCPFVGKHYGSGAMQDLQRKYTAEDVTWLSIISSAPGKNGHVDAAGALANQRDRKSAPTAILLDPNGEVGKKYRARTTPHMFIIDKESKLLYQGAIDNRRAPFKIIDAVGPTKNLFADSLNLALIGEPIPEDVATNAPYGCAVHY